MGNHFSIETTLLHTNDSKDRIDQAVSTPVFQTAMFMIKGNQEHHTIPYIRRSNSPNHAILHKKLALIEKKQSALVLSSGMAAISSCLLNCLQNGDHLIAQSDLYGGTLHFIKKEFPSTNRAFSFVDIHNPQTWEKALTAKTKAFFIEAVGNHPHLRVPDFEQISLFCKKHNLISIIDSTLATPYNFNPGEVGIDIIIHSCTKYMNGHSDIVGGCVIGDKEIVSTIQKSVVSYGGCMDPHTCFLLERGLKTLPLRMEKHNDNALKLAQFLSQHEAIDEVYYPGLKNHPDYKHTKKYFKGFGGMLFFSLKQKGEKTAENFIQSLNIPLSAPSLGGVETLICRPAATTHSSMPREERIKIGVSDDIMRVSVGIEHPDDLIKDFEQAFSKLSRNKAA